MEVFNLFTVSLFSLLCIPVVIGRFTLSLSVVLHFFFLLTLCSKTHLSSVVLQVFFFKIYSISNLRISCFTLGKAGVFGCHLNKLTNMFVNLYIYIHIYIYIYITVVPNNVFFFISLSRS
jgi:hypothetical protein